MSILRLTSALKSRFTTGITAMVTGITRLAATAAITATLRLTATATLTARRVNQSPTRLDIQRESIIIRYQIEMMRDTTETANSDGLQWTSVSSGEF
jgi:hypothetical protein